MGLSLVRDRLRQACSELDHQFWPDDVSLRDTDRFDFGRIHGHDQVTDVYLLALAVRHGGCLVTFDQAIALSAVPSTATAPAGAVEAAPADVAGATGRPGFRPPAGPPRVRAGLAA